MNGSQDVLAKAALWFTFGSAVSILVSIAVSQILLALAIATLLMSGTRLRMPPVWLPLGLFMAATVVSLALSGNASAGRPQIRKFFVYLMLVVVFSALRHLADVRRLVLGWAAVGAVSGGIGLVQFLRKLYEARQHGQNFYDYYVAERITGFLSHWMTFGGAEMIALIMLAAFLLFSPHARRIPLAWGIPCAAVLALALLLGMTRSIWLAAAGACLYLLWFWNRRLLLALPVLLAGVLWLGPAAVRVRVVSLFAPKQQVDSNQHRIVCWRTGWVMIKAHPWFGLGPEMPRIKFMEYVPADIPRPLPAGWYGHLHNIYIHYAAERGIPAMLILVWMLAKILWDFLGAVRKLPAGRSEPKFILHGAIAVVIATMISGLFEVNLGDSEVLTMFLSVVACGYLAAEKAPEAEIG